MVKMFRRTKEKGAIIGSLCYRVYGTLIKNSFADGKSLSESKMFTFDFVI